MLFDQNGLIKHYTSPEMIVQEFFDLRLEFYDRRRSALLRVRTGPCSHSPGPCATGGG